MSFHFSEMEKVVDGNRKFMKRSYESMSFSEKVDETVGQLLWDVFEEKEYALSKSFPDAKDKICRALEAEIDKRNSKAIKTLKYIILQCDEDMAYQPNACEALKCFSHIEHMAVDGLKI